MSFPANDAAGQLIAFHSGRRGSGRSFICRHLAIALQARKKRVVVVDLDPDVKLDHCLAWSLPATPNLAESMDQLSRLDRQTIKGYFPEQPEGVTLVVMATDPQQAVSLTNHMVIKALILLKTAYDCVLIDGLMGWSSLTLEILDLSDQVLMVCLPDLISLKQASQDSQHYQQYKFPLSKIKVLINEADRPGGISMVDYRQALEGHEVVGELPYFNHALEVNNQHYSIKRRFIGSKLDKALDGLARQVLRWSSDSRERGDQMDYEEKASFPDSPKALNLVAIKTKIHQALLDHDALASLNLFHRSSPENKNILRDKVESAVTSLMALEAPKLNDRELRERVVKEIIDEALGLGPLEDLIQDDAINEIMVNHCDQIYIEQKGKLVLSQKKFLNEKQLLTVIERIVAPLGRRIDESQPYVDARLPDGSRVNAIIPPLALKGPCLTIRKFSKQRLHVADLVALETIPSDWSDFLQACVLGRKNIIIAGGTGSGKTTLLNILSAFIPEDDRIITIEDAAELNLQQAHVVTLEARPANIEGKGAVTIRDLVKNSLRMTPTRIVVGECRGGEVLDMLQAMNTGHEGSLTTVHANSPKDTMTRLETMVLLSGLEIPVKAIREQIISAIDVIIQLSRMPDGSRKVTTITEVCGIKNEMLVLNDIFKFEQSGVNKNHKILGRFVSTGYQPSFLEELTVKGIAIKQSWFACKGKKS